MDTPLQPSGLVIETGAGNLTRQATGRLIAILTERTCGEACWNAKEDVCRCECGGKNHGIHLRGGTGCRASKLGGYRYELAAVGKHRDMMRQGALLTAQAWIADGSYTENDVLWFNGKRDELQAAGWIEIHHLKGAGSLYAVKYATLAQCLKWPELDYFGVADDRDRYKSDAAILWKREDRPTY